jgi:GntR family transcriptional regulator
MMERIDAASDRAVYRQIADHLRRDIAEGRVMPGAQLPSESQLMAQYDVSRVTARRALGVLVTEGLVIAEHGRGWFVRRRPPVKRLGSDRFARRGEGKAAFTVDMEASNRSFSVEVLYVGTGAVPEDIAPRLEVAAGDEVVIRRRRYLAEGQPVEYATSYIPADVAEGTRIVEVNPGPGGIYARMEDKGMTFERYDEEVTARMPSDEEARLLALPAGSPVIHLVRTAVADGRPVEVCDTVMDAAAFVLHYTLPARMP